MHAGLRSPALQNYVNNGEHVPQRYQWNKRSDRYGCGGKLACRHHDAQQKSNGQEADAAQPG